jgi:origin recognition complex subunit 3
VEKLLDEGQLEIVRSLLEDDSLLSILMSHLSYCRGAANRLLNATEILEVSRGCLQGRSSISRSELYVKAVSGELNGSVIVRDLLLSIKKMPSDALSSLLGRLLIHAGDDEALRGLLVVNSNLQTLINSGHAQGQQLRSEHDIRHETLRTTVIAQKVEISVQKSALSKQDSAYSKFVNQAHDILEDYFSTNLINPQDIFLHEVFFYDLKSPHRDVFTPKPRFAIERALSAPHDYLGCSCCGADGEALESTQPPTAVLYQLYQESGALVNVFDLWTAFYAVIGGEGGEDCDESNAMWVHSRIISYPCSRPLCNTADLVLTKITQLKGLVLPSCSRVEILRDD